MKLSERDIRILIGLRHGIMDIHDLVEEHFCNTELEIAHDGFQKHLSKQIYDAQTKLERTNTELMNQVKRVCQQTNSTVPLFTQLREVSVRYGTQLGKPLTQLLHDLPTLIEENKGDRNIILESYQAVIKAFYLGKINKRRAALCKKIMARLEGGKFVRKIAVTSRKGIETYYHLTKHTGKPLVQQILSESGDYGAVVAHNYCPIHAKHDSMVTIAIKRLEALAREQNYILHGFMHESEQKGVSLEKRLDQAQRFNQNIKRRKKKQFFSDLLVQILCEGQVVNLNIEIDNGTQSIRNVLGKVDAGLPIIILCSTPHRAGFLVSRLIQAHKNKIFVTTIHQFRQGGLFSSIYRSNLYEEYAHIDVNMLVND